MKKAIIFTFALVATPLAFAQDPSQDFKLIQGGVVFHNPLKAPVQVQLNVGSSSIGCVVGGAGAAIRIDAGSKPAPISVGPDQAIECRNIGGDAIVPVSVSAHVNAPQLSFEDAGIIAHKTILDTKEKIGSGPITPSMMGSFIVLDALGNLDKPILAPSTVTVPAATGSVDVGDIKAGDLIQFRTPDGKLTLPNKKTYTATGIARAKTGPKKDTPVKDASLKYPTKNRYAMVCVLTPTDGTAAQVLYTAGEPEEGATAQLDGKVSCELNDKKNPKARLKGIKGDLTAQMVQVTQADAVAKLQSLLDKDEKARQAASANAVGGLNDAVGAELARLQSANNAAVAAYENTVRIAAQKRQEEADRIAAAKAADQQRVQDMADAVFRPNINLTYGVVSAEFQLAPKKTRDQESGIDYMDLAVVNPTVKYALMSPTTGQAMDETHVVHENIFGDAKAIPTTLHWDDVPNKSESFVADNTKSYGVCSQRLSDAKDARGADTSVTGLVNALVTNPPATIYPGLIDSMLVKAGANADTQTCHQIGKNLIQVQLTRQEGAFRFCYGKVKVNKRTGREYNDLVGYVPLVIKSKFAGTLGEDQITKWARGNKNHPFFDVVNHRVLLHQLYPGDNLPDQYCVDSKTIDPPFDQDTQAVAGFFAPPITTLKDGAVAVAPVTTNPAPSDDSDAGQKKGQATQVAEAQPVAPAPDSSGTATK